MLRCGSNGHDIPGPCATARPQDGRRHTNALAYARRTESTVLLKGPETLDAELLQEEEDEAKAKVQAEKAPPRLAMSTDGSRIENQATGYTVVRIWAGIETPMGCNQETYNAECAALARVRESPSRRNTAPERVIIFSDVQPAMRRPQPETVR